MSLMEQHTPESWKAYVALAKSTLAEGAIPGKYKELIAVVLSVAAHCKP
jgi:alkylhydroperoxidase/carboxymuconolactone decarboxylase family protein YurZ